MAVSKKGKRKVTVRGRHYLWYVDGAQVRLPDQGFVAHQRTRLLHIISFDKQLIVHYQHPQPGDDCALLFVEGPSFPRRPGADVARVPRWRRDVKYPNPDFVRRLINWCLEESTT